MRLFLFDENARLLDAWEIAGTGENQCVTLADPVAGAGAFVEVIPRRDASLPADAALDLIIDGKKVRRFDASVRVDLLQGRLAVAP